MADHSHPHAEPPDTVGQLLSAVCAVHCVATPLVVVLAPAAASVFGGAHPVLLAMVIGVALWAFIPGYRCHHSKLVAALAVGGITALSVAAFVLHGSLLAESIVSLIGATLMMFAHWQNRKLLQAHAHSHAEAHVH